MSNNTNVYVDEYSLYNIANAIRYKLNVGTRYLPSQFSNAVNNIGIVNYEYKDTSRMFYKGARLSNIDDIMPLCNNTWNCAYMFAESNITDAPCINGHFIHNTQGMFYNCTNLVNVPSSYYFWSVMFANSMFYNCTSLVNAPYLSFHSCELTNSLFQGCSNLTNIPSMDVGSVINAAYMFAGCGIENLPELNFSRVSTINSLCQGCTKLTNITYLNVGYELGAAQAAFYGCTNLVNAPVLNTDNLILSAFMFAECYSLANVPQYNTAKVNNMSNMFMGCNNLSTGTIQNIVNMCLLASNIPTIFRNLNNSNQFSPLYRTKFSKTYYQSRWSQLQAAGWSY